MKERNVPICYSIFALLPSYFLRNSINERNSSGNGTNTLLLPAVAASSIFLQFALHLSCPCTVTHLFPVSYYYVPPLPAITMFQFPSRSFFSLPLTLTHTQRRLTLPLLYPVSLYCTLLTHHSTCKILLDHPKGDTFRHFNYCNFSNFLLNILPINFISIKFYRENNFSRSTTL